MEVSASARCGLCAEAFLLSAEFGCQRRAKIFRLKDLSDFNLAILIMGIWAALDPFDCFLFRLDLPQLKTCDEFLRLSEWPVSHLTPLAGKFYTRTFGRRVQALGG